jgi:hypothetical protein
MTFLIREDELPSGAFVLGSDVYELDRDGDIYADSPRSEVEDAIVLQARSTLTCSVEHSSSVLGGRSDISGIDQHQLHRLRQIVLVSIGPVNRGMPGHRAESP